MHKFEDFENSDDIFSSSSSSSSKEVYRFGTINIGAIVLIYDDGIVDIIHDDVFEDKTGGLQTGWRRWPCLDPQSITCTGKSALPHRQPSDIFLIGIFAETSDADAVAGTAYNIKDGQIGATWADGDAVITGADDRVGNLDIGRVGYVDAISVRAVSRSTDFDGIKGDVS